MITGTLLMLAATTIGGFSVQSVEPLPGVGGKVWRMEYEKNGAELVWVDCPDENRTFSIIFKTLPNDDTGVAHILEHSVLCGSEKFPSREPFVELLKSSPHTFLNACTGEDMTAYPVASRNEKDFLNLTEVYLDAVFKPLSVRSDWAMRQEGWHYEYDGTNLTRNGVVYSEMKGALSGASSLALNEMLRQLFPDSPYRFVSGGDPKHIPELTHEKYCAFYHQFYHPSNSRIFLYGKIDLEKTLKLIAKAIEPYERRTEKVEIPVQNPVFGKTTQFYPSSVEKDRTLISDGWVYGTYDAREELLGLELLGELLTENNFSPLKQPLVEAGLCEDVGFGVFRKLQPIVLLQLRNVTDGKVEECRELVRRTLQELVKRGFDGKALARLIDRREFAWRERDSSDLGIELFYASLDTWLYGGDPVEELRGADIFDALRAKIGTGWYEELLIKAILKNNHHCEVTMVPSKTLEAEQNAADRAELAALQAKMSAEELKAIAEAAADLKRRHSEPEDPSVLAKLPTLSLKDMPAEVELPKSTTNQFEGVTLLRPEIALDGFHYLDLAFSLEGLQESEFMDVPFLAALFGELKSRDRSAAELKGEMDGTFGYFDVKPVAYEKGPQLIVRIAALDAKKSAALELLKEILFRTDFTETNAVEACRQQLKARYERGTLGRRAMEMARIRASRNLSECDATQEALEGIAQLRHLQRHQAGDLRRLADRIFTRERMTICASPNVDEGHLKAVVEAFPKTGAVMGPRLSLVEARSPFEGFEIDGGIAHAALSAKLPAGVNYCGAHLVAAKILALEHLWPEVRVKGGAYGARFSVRPNGTLSFLSFRDPQPKRTYGIWSEAADWLERFANGGDSIEKFQVATLEETDPNLSRRQQMAYARSVYFNERGPALMKRLRKEILGMRRTELNDFSEVLRRVEPTGSKCVIGGKEVIAPCGTEQTERVIF